jgi:hypothetical protein
MKMGSSRSSRSQRIQNSSRKGAKSLRKFAPNFASRRPFGAAENLAWKTRPDEEAMGWDTTIVGGSRQKTP